jgi:uncharacterized protein YkwD
MAATVAVLLVAACSSRGDTPRLDQAYVDDVIDASSRALSAPQFRDHPTSTVATPMPVVDGPEVQSTTTTDPARAVEVELLDLTNADRAVVGARSLTRDADLDDYARAHAATMMAQGSISHSRIETLLGAWWFVGENVGTGPAALAIQGAYRASPGHFRNLTHEDFTTIGVGVVLDAAGRIWTVQIFAA